MVVLLLNYEENSGAIERVLICQLAFFRQLALWHIFSTDSALCSSGQLSVFNINLMSEVTQES